MQGLVLAQFRECSETPNTTFDVSISCRLYPQGYCAVFMNTPFFETSHGNNHRTSGFRIREHVAAS